MMEISDKLYDALIEFYNAYWSYYNEDDETGYSKEDFLEAKTSELIEILADELPDE